MQKLNLQGIDYLLFDLDGTLLQWESDAFLQDYMSRIAGYVAAVTEPKHFAKCLWSATEQMIRDQNPDKTNQQVFEEHFFQALGVPRDKIWPLIDRFYTEEFTKLRKHAHPNGLSRKIVETAVEKGFRVVLATNPVFPIVAVEERMRWAGIEGLPFERVTTYESSRFCKPSPGFYEELVKEIGTTPERCMMIGNDLQEDIVAGTLGMKTYWVTDQSINRENGPVYVADAAGTLADLLGALEQVEARAAKGV